MQALTLVVKMTGLLLLTPHTQDGRPVHVLMVAPHDGTVHHAQIGYYRRNGTTLKYCLSSTEVICWVRMDQWSLDLGMGAGSKPTGPPPFGGGNLVPRMTGRLPNDHGGDNPGGVRARVTLHAGSVTNECANAEWEVDKPGNSSHPQMVNLINVLEWTIQNAGQGRIALRRKPINPAGRPTGPDSLAVDMLKPDPGKHEIELFVRHVPQSEPQVDCTAGGRAEHFRSYYRYLGIRNVRPPRCERELTSCKSRFPELRSVFPRLMESPGTLACMIASTDPK